LPTLTELAVLALYGQAVGTPYILIARTTQNGLTFGPLHDRVKRHIAKLIEDPDLLLGPSATYETGSLDAIAWVRPDVILAIREMSPRLPVLRPMLVAFLKGA
ncbi:hypothetical protein C8Q72DRAFT_749613, partial [Fomitopsis betulina]